MAIANTISEWYRLYTDYNFNIFKLLFSIAVVLYIINLFENNDSKATKYAVLYVVWQIICYTIIMLIDSFVSFDLKVIRDIGHFFLPAISGSVINMEYGYIFVILGVILYLCKNNKKDLITYYSYFCLFYLWITTSTFLSYLSKIEIIPGFLENIIGFSTRYAGCSMFKVNIQWMMIFALPLMLMYNNKKGSKWKYFYYIFYPVHIILFSVLGDITTFNKLL